MKNIVYINVNEIYEHPDNPRKDLGDLSELADSIRENGIFQNLTVVPLKSKIKPDLKLNGYTVIIGHRRLAAAKLAGLDVVPCIVTEMDEKTQLSTMLLENMQRSDLTVYEQAQGFQMMLDLGSTVSELSKKTGFSPTTIHHRINLLNLDKEKFKESESRGARITDYIELEKIKDIKKRNELLEKIGTPDFNYSIKRAIEEEKKKQNVKDWTDLFDSIPSINKTTDRSNKKYITSFAADLKLTEENKLRIITIIDENLEKKNPLYWFFDGWGTIYIYTDTAESDSKESSWKREERLRNKRNALISDLEETAYQCRLEFVKNYTGKKEELTVLLEELLNDLSDWIDADENEVIELLGIDDIEDEEALKDNKKFQYIVCNQPQKAVLAYVFLRLDYYGEKHNRQDFHDWTGKPILKSSIKTLYDILGCIGYDPSNDEIMLMQGTHPVFKQMSEVTDDEH